MLNDRENIGTSTNNSSNVSRKIVRIKRRITKFQRLGTNKKTHIKTNGALVGHAPTTKIETLSRTPSFDEDEEDSSNFNDDDAQYNKQKRLKINQDDHVHTYKRLNVGAAESTFEPDYNLIVSWL